AALLVCELDELDAAMLAPSHGRPPFSSSLLTIVSSEAAAAERTDARCGQTIGGGAAMNEAEELLQVTREVRDQVATRLSARERRRAGRGGDRPRGYVPDDVDDGGRDDDGRRLAPVARSGLELAPRDSYAAWWARTQGGERVEPGEFSLGRLIQAMW